MRASSSCFFFSIGGVVVVKLRCESSFCRLVELDVAFFFLPSIDRLCSPLSSPRQRSHLGVRLPRLHHGQALGHVVRDEVDRPAHGQGLVGRDGRGRRRAADRRLLLFVAAAADDGRAAAHARAAQAPAHAAVLRVRAVAVPRAGGGCRGPAADLQGARRAGELRSAGGSIRAVFFRDGNGQRWRGRRGRGRRPRLGERDGVAHSEIQSACGAREEEENARVRPSFSSAWNEGKR